MNENSIKWITLNGMDLSPVNLSLPEKLEKFGYSIVFNEFGEDKATKAQLCILDVMNAKEKANILIICPQRFMQSWYSSLLLGIGADFKFVAPFSDSIMFFSKEMSNFYIMGENVLTSDKRSPVLEGIEKDNIAWDLMIIDTSSDCEGMESELYTGNIGFKAEKLVIFAPYPSSYNGEVSNVRDIVKAVLFDEDKARGVDFYTVDASVMEFTINNPLMKYPSQTERSRKIRKISYSYDEKLLESWKKLDESQLSAERGGNLFEEYAPDERKTFLKTAFKAPDAEELRSVDKKLDEFLKLADEIINDPAKTGIVYFNSDEILDYVFKTLIALYPDKKPQFAVLNNSVFEVGQSAARLNGCTAVPKLVLATDYLDETCSVYAPFTHVINYELPSNPVVFQQRYMRRDRQFADEAEFIIFLDENGLFDSRILGKVLCGNLYKAFNHSVPGENAIFSVEGIEQMIADMLLDIKYIADYTGSVGASFDVITRFKLDYNIPDSRNLTTAARTHEYSKRKLLTLSKAFGLGDVLLKKDVDAGALKTVISEKVEAIRSGYAIYDDSDEIKTVSRGMARNGHFEAFANEISKNRFVSGLAEAKKRLDEMLGGKTEYPYIKGELAGLSDSMRNAVLFNIWEYYRTKGIDKSYKEFIKAYNEGVI